MRNQQKIYQELRIKAAYIADNLGELWRFDTRKAESQNYHMGVRIVGPERLSIALRDGERMHKSGMISIYGENPCYGRSHRECRALNAYKPPKSINVSWGRSPKSIAADIERRLLPNYVQAAAEAQTKTQQFESDMDLMRNVENALRKVAPSLRNYGCNAHSRHRQYSFESGHKYRSHTLELSGCNGLSCNLKLSDLAPETAMRVMALLREADE